MPGNRLWTPLTAFLITVIAIGAIFIWSRNHQSQPTELILTHDSSAELTASIYIGGEVSNPGIYPLKAEDTINYLIRAAGGSEDNAATQSLSLNVGDSETLVTPQKININRAEAWLLEALPGIGETRTPVC